MVTLCISEMADSCESPSQSAATSHWQGGHKRPWVGQRRKTSVLGGGGTLPPGPRRRASSGAPMVVVTGSLVRGSCPEAADTPTTDRGCVLACVRGVAALELPLSLLG